jgi:hypothetical protein
VILTFDMTTNRETMNIGEEPAYPVPPEDRKLFEEKGEDYVRSTWGGSGVRHPAAKAWLAMLDKARRVEDEKWRAEQTRMAKSTLRVSNQTLWVAIIGAGAAIIAVVISYLAWQYPPH